LHDTVSEMLEDKRAIKPFFNSLRATCACLLVAGAVVAVYRPSLGNGFVNLDDTDYVFANQEVRNGLSLRGIAWAFTAFHAANWHPLTWLSHMLDVTLFGMRPSGHHLTSVMLHAAASVLLLLLLRAMTGALWRSTAVALLFAVHPLQVESVAWVSERKNVLSTLLWLLTVAAYLQYARRPGRARLAAVAALLALGLTAKPMLVTVPVTLLLFDWWPLGRWKDGWPDRRLLLEKAPLLLLAACAGALTFLAQSGSGAVASTRLYPLWTRLANAAANLAIYPAQALWPAALAAHYPHPGMAVSLAGAAAGGAFAVVATLLAFRFRGRAPYALWGWSWFIVTLLPVAGIIQVGEQSRADRYAYVVLIGPYLAAAWACAGVAGDRPLRRLGMATGWAGALVALAFAARAQTAVWHDGVSLFTRVVTVAPQSAKGHLNLGVALTEKGQFEEALDHLRRAGAFWPEESLVPYNIGLTLEKLGRMPDAATAYREALRLRPDFPQAHSNLGLLLESLGEPEEALAHLLRAAELAPVGAEMQSNLATALLARGRGAEALERQREAAQLDPKNPSIRFNFGNQLADAGNLAEAALEYREALRLDPTQAAAHNNLGVVLMLLGETAEARREFRETLRIAPRHPGARANLQLLSGGAAE
jgi:Flp pilus assembly protein TadD